MPIARMWCGLVALLALVLLLPGLTAAQPTVNFGPVQVTAVTSDGQPGVRIAVAPVRLTGAGGQTVYFKCYLSPDGNNWPPAGTQQLQAVTIRGDDVQWTEAISFFYPVAQLATLSTGDLRGAFCLQASAGDGGFGRTDFTIPAALFRAPAAAETPGIPAVVPRQSTSRTAQFQMEVFAVSTSTPPKMQRMLRLLSQGIADGKARNDAAVISGMTTALAEQAGALAESNDYYNRQGVGPGVFPIGTGYNRPWLTPQAQSEQTAKAAEVTRYFLLAPYYFRANAYMVSDQDQLAINDFTWLLKSGLVTDNESKANIYKCRGLCYENDNRNDSAIADYTNSLALFPDDASVWAWRAEKYTVTQNYRAALADYSEAVRLDPQYAAAYAGRGNCHDKLGYRDQAVADWDAAHRLKPDVYYRGQTILARRAGAAVYDAGDYAAATTHYNEAIRLEPAAASYKDRADCYDQLEQYEPAIADYTEAVRLDPQYAAAYAARGSCHYELGHREQAVADWDMADRLKPNDYFGSQTILARRAGAAAWAVGDYAAAITHYNEAIRLEPTAINYESRGHCYYQLKQYEQAIADYSEVVRLNPQRAFAFSIRGDCHYELGHRDQAVADWDAAHRLDPDYFGGQTILARRAGAAVYDAGDYAAAVTHYSEAIRLEPAVTNYKDRADCYYQLEQYETAIWDYTEAVRLDPQDAGAYASRGNCHYELGHRDQAVADWDMAHLLDPDYFGGQTMLARHAGGAAYDAGDYATAVTHYGEAIRRQPTASHYRDRANAYYCLKQYAPAIADYTEALRMDTQSAEAHL